MSSEFVIRRAQIPQEENHSQERIPHSTAVVPPSPSAPYTAAAAAQRSATRTLTAAAVHLAAHTQTVDAEIPAVVADRSNSPDRIPAVGFVGFGILAGCTGSGSSTVRGEWECYAR